MSTIIINYPHMTVGGIENYIIELLQKLLNTEHRIIWMCDHNCSISDVYKEIMNNPRIERCVCNSHGMSWFKHGKIEIDGNEDALILSFSFFDHARALDLKRKSHAQIIALFLIPHFTGALLFPEQGLTKSLQKIYFGKISRIYKAWQEAEIVRYFSAKHIETLERTYSIKVENPKEMIVPDFAERAPFDEKEVIARYNKEEFVIISAGRFEFPHKGYVIGLIKVFASLKRKYPQLRLLIVGGGAGRTEIDEEINKLPPDTASAIEIHKEVSFKELIELFKESSLNISVAGCASAAAQNGVITLPARHYTYNCEVYGFFPESKSMTTETREGEAVVPYIERVINMTEEEYVEYSKRAYESFSDDSKISIDYFFKVKDTTKDYNVPKSDLRIIKQILFFHRLQYLKQRIFGGLV